MEETSYIMNTAITISAPVSRLSLSNTLIVLSMEDFELVSSLGVNESE